MIKIINRNAVIHFTGNTITTFSFPWSSSWKVYILCQSDLISGTLFIPFSLIQYYCYKTRPWEKIVIFYNNYLYYFFIYFSRCELWVPFHYDEFLQHWFWSSSTQSCRWLVNLSTWKISGPYYTIGCHVKKACLKSLIRITKI